jgi:hypothetical protein
MLQRATRDAPLVLDRMNLACYSAYRLVCGSCGQQKGRTSGQEERELHIEPRSVNNKCGELSSNRPSCAGEISKMSQRG